MCISPQNLPAVGLVSCRNCWQCRSNRVNDLVGRAIAESHAASLTVPMTLTYGGGDHARAAVLVYADVQKFLKRLRKAGYRVRYFVAGEYGSKKSRAHWHIVLFFHGATLPEITDDWQDRDPNKLFFARWENDAHARRDWIHWEHGYIYAEKPAYAAFRYILKYVQKGKDSDTEVNHYAMSKKPPLGDDYFWKLAHRYAVAGLAPQSFQYAFDGEFTPKGERRQFLLQGVSRTNFLRAYEMEWDRLRPNQPLPASPVLEEWADEQVREDPEWQEHQYHADRAYRGGYATMEQYLAANAPNTTGGIRASDVPLWKRTADIDAWEMMQRWPQEDRESEDAQEALQAIQRDQSEINSTSRLPYSVRKKRPTRALSAQASEAIEARKRRVNSDLRDWPKSSG